MNEWKTRHYVGLIVILVIGLTTIASLLKPEIIIYAVRFITQ
jgi:hypothetical protein